VCGEEKYMKIIKSLTHIYTYISIHTGLYVFGRIIPKLHNTSYAREKGRSYITEILPFPSNFYFAILFTFFAPYIHYPCKEGIKRRKMGAPG